MRDISDYRKEIDSIDSKIAALLQERRDVVKAIAAYKEARGLPVFDAAREHEKRQVLKSICSSEAGSYVSGVFEEIMAQSRKLQQGLLSSADKSKDSAVPAYGLLGRNLTHSYSPQIHRIIGDYEFGLIDCRPEQLDAFFDERAFCGITVTMPYKKTVMQYCDEISETAMKCGSVNTIVKRADGTLYGDNTDYYGFRSTVLVSGAEISGAKAIVLGSGGVSGTAAQVLRDLGAASVVVISRTGSDNYDNLSRHYDAKIVVNATPVGMYPHAGAAAVDICEFETCEAVFDLVYNPLRTKLMLDAAEAGIPALGGLRMLTAQAAKAYQLFCRENPGLKQDGEADLETVTDLACRQLQWEMENIVLIGMPGCGKTTIGRRVAEITGKPFVDCDERIIQVHGRSPEEIITEDGIEAFRDVETAVIRQVLREDAEHASGIVFATGGGCVEREENRVLLRENSLVIYIRRDIDQLPVDGRPISQNDGLEKVFQRRQRQYENWSDMEVKV